VAQTSLCGLIALSRITFECTADDIFGGFKAMLGKIVSFYYSWQASRRSQEQLLEALSTSGQVVAEKFVRAGDTANNREVARHIIGIERWSRRRLQTVLGDVAVMDEYDGYRPDEAESMVTLAELFVEARAQTIALAHQAANLPNTVRVAHNDLGQMDVGAWLFYIENHAARECLRLRG
jgi:hypothetical protein